ncbi:acetyltransferase [Paeniglutamicibacter psychrophenolicus]|uniref:Sugar O-acyltransferase (Sialic acid O-acetyltransferase NeuD family) n=1 Tax=Paeniglutamicibacter psychrophenolicus TaxID=257454 RepID=A0ABS4WIA6_9MICC|nr:NeuD/PglB/VioB family sugar acetyltransferase [Paeniglutamicibacter psychrophenolicus]MBP2375925.1 sugar O-acyltransferase (sialic acid O-acetyltransferase NeuD family) [Paeniglutamicibacter psychrophenolicus]
MSRILLLAAGGLARETASSITDTGDHEVVGMLDDFTALHGHLVAGVRVLGGIALAAERSELLLVCAGNGQVRRGIVHRLRTLGVGPERYAGHVSRSASVGVGCSLGPGSIVLPGCVLTCDVTVGAHVVLMPRVVLTHDNHLGDYATLAAGVVLGGGTCIGAAAYLGMNASVRQDLEVGDGAVLGMGAVLLQDQPANCTWAGNPAHRLGPAPFNTSSMQRHALAETAGER